MQRLPVTLSVTLALLLTASVAPAQDAKAAGDALLAELTEADEAMCGTTQFAFTVNGMNSGNYAMRVEKAPGGAPDGAAYVVHVKGKVSFAGQSFSGVEVIRLDSAFALLSRVSTEEEGDAKSPVVKETDMGRADGGWTYLQTKTGKRTRKLSTFSGRNHGGKAGKLLLARKLAGHAPGTLELSALEWKGTAGKTVTLTVEIKAPAELEHRGETVQSQAIRFVQPGGTTSMQIDAAGNVLSWGPEGTPLRLIAGTAEQVGAKPEVPELKGTPLDAVVVYFEVLAKIKPTSALDAVMDWAAIKEGMAKDNEGIAALTAQSIGDLLKSQFDKSPAALDAPTLAAIQAMLVEKIDGDTATVLMEGKEADAFVLQKSDGAWKITRFPH